MSWKAFKYVTAYAYFQIGVNVIGLPEIVTHEYTGLEYVASLAGSKYHK